MTQPEEYVRFKLYYPKNPTVDDRIGIQMQYRRVEVIATLPDGPEGDADIKRLMQNFPDILQLARHERTIQQEVDGMGAEIDKLLGDLE